MAKKTIVISSVLPRLLKERGMTAKALSRLAEVPQSTVASWLVPGARPRNVEDVAAAAEVLEVSLPHLLFGEVDEATDLETIPAETVLSGVYRLRLERLVMPERKKSKSKGNKG